MICKVLSLFVPENIALGKPTWQSSDNYDDKYKSPQAVDGDRNPDMQAGSCTHTKRNSRAWWAVDLRAVADIIMVAIKNRADCCCEWNQITHYFCS